MLRRSACLRVKLDESRLLLSSEGRAPHTAPHRVRMPWTKSTEAVPVQVYRARDKSLIDGAELYKGIARVDMLEPMLAIKAICAKRQHLTSTGLTLFQIAAHLTHSGRGQRFWRDNWQDGTSDKFVTLSRISFERDMSEGGEAWGYMTFQGESTLRPIKIPHAEVPGWHCEFVEAAAVPPSQIVNPPPSIGTDVPVDPRAYRLKAYPFYDAPASPEWVVRRYKDLGILPDPVVDAEGGDAPGGDDADGSTHADPK